jgi:hypothetical protein
LCTLANSDKTVVVPSNLFSSLLQYNVDYHIVVESGFVTDVIGNPFAGILVQDINTGASDGINDWSLQDWYESSAGICIVQPERCYNCIDKPAGIYIL